MIKLAGLGETALVDFSWTDREPVCAGGVLKDEPQADRERWANGQRQKQINPFLPATTHLSPRMEWLSIKQYHCKHSHTHSSLLLKRVVSKPLYAVNELSTLVFDNMPQGYFYENNTSKTRRTFRLHYTKLHVLVKQISKSTCIMKTVGNPLLKRLLWNQLLK
jgi:hypothetical protein